MMKQFMLLATLTLSTLASATTYECFSHSYGGTEYTMKIKRNKVILKSDNGYKQKFSKEGSQIMNISGTEYDMISEDKLFKSDSLYLERGMLRGSLQKGKAIRKSTGMTGFDLRTYNTHMDCTLK
jgi:hypothetical protein